MSYRLKRSEGVSEVIHSARYRVVCARDTPIAVDQTEKIVAIDNLRASGTIVTALSMGVETIIPVADDHEAFQLAAQGCLTIGEKGGHKIDGYEMGNSPVELSRRLSRQPVKNIAMKTSNLIPLLLKLPHAYICSTLNLSAVAGVLAGERVCVIAAGGEHGMAEDTGTAFALVSLLCGVRFDKRLTVNFTHESNASRHLKQIGASADVDFISRMDVYDIVPYYDGKEVRCI